MAQPRERAILGGDLRSQNQQNRVAKASVGTALPSRSIADSMVIRTPLKRPRWFAIRVRGGRALRKHPTRDRASVPPWSIVQGEAKQLARHRGAGPTPRLGK